MTIYKEQELGKTPIYYPTLHNIPEVKEILSNISMYSATIHLYRQAHHPLVS